MKQVTLWVAALVAGATSTPWQPRTTTKCSSYCKDSSKVLFEPGTVYIYDYLADSVTSLQSPSGEDSRLRISAQLELEAEDRCELVLRLWDVALFESQSGELVLSDGSQDFAAALQRYPLRVSYQDGTVESICTAPEEPWVTNIKRGILSAMQNTMADSADSQTVLETDISGYCETNYTKVSSGTVRRTKDLLGCSGRHAFQHTNVKMVPYNTMSAVQSAPLLQSSHACEQTIRSHRIHSATCTETHSFRPFSSETSGAQTTIRQSLTYQTQETRSVPFPEIKLSRSSLVFDPSNSKPALGGKDRVVVELLNSLVKNSGAELSSEVPQLFGSLIGELKQMTYTQVAKVYYNTEDQKARKYLIDALPSVGTAAAFGMLRDLIRDRALTETEEKVWLTSLAFQTRPNLEMIVAVAPLLQEARPSKSALLGVSSLLHHYCSSVDCNESDEVKSIVRDIEKKLGNGCRSLDDDSKEAILVALKALGNAGIVVTSADVLKKCYQENNPMEVRLAAIAAVRRVSCDFDRSNLMSLYRDIAADSELRIAAYLAAMKCPDQKVLDQVKEALQSEPVNQVGSFVWTHLTNLQESLDPNKQEVKQLLEDEFFKNKFNTDARKFSRNFEFSSFWEELNVGGTVDSNIIFSTQSYIPRSAMLNLTLDLFGESVNLLEIGGRVEGLEPLIEQLFGPDGYFPDDTVENVLKSFRGKREVDTTALGQLVSSFDGKYGVAPEASVFMKVFGNELHYSNMKGFCTEPDCNLFKKLNVGSSLDAIFAFLRDSNVDYSKTFQFLDVSTSVPTAIGLPLTLSANGTSTVNLKMAGKVSIKNWRSFDVGGSLKPSAVVEINSVMAVDAGLTRSGIKVRNTLRTATSLDGRVQISGGELVSVHLDTPKDKVEVFEIQSDVFLINKNEHKKPKIDLEVKRMCSSDILGASVCSEVQYPKGAAPFPLTPSKLGLYIEKTDSHTGYQFEYKWTNEIVKKQSVQNIMLTFDMPGSRLDRRLATKLTIDEPGRALRFSLQCPSKRIDATGKYINSDSMKSTDVIVNVDGEEFVSLKASLRSDAKLSSGRFEPSLVVTRKGAEVLNLKGSLNYLADSKYGLNLTLSQLTEEPIRVTGDIVRDNGKYEVSAALRSYMLTSNLKGSVKATENVFNTKMSLDYSVKQGAQQKLDLAGKWSTTTKDSLQKYVLNWNLISTQFPVANSELSWELLASHKYVENEGKIAVAGESWSLHQLYSKDKIGREESFKVKLALQSEKRGVDYHASYSHVESDKLFSHKMKFKSSDKNEYSTVIEFETEDNRQSVRLEGVCPYSSAYFRSDVVDTDRDVVTLTAAGKWGDQEETKLVAKLSNMDTFEEMKRSIQADLTRPAMEPIKFSGELHASQAKSTILAKIQKGQNAYDITVGHNFDGENHKIQCTVAAPEMKPVIIKSVISVRRFEKAISVEVQSLNVYSFDGRFKNDNLQFLVSTEVFWDKENDLAKTALFSINHTAQKLDATVKYPGREVTLTTTTAPSKVTGALSWSPREKVSLKVDRVVEGNATIIKGKVETPFVGFEEVSVKTKYEKDAEKLNAEFSGRWKATQASFSLVGQKTDDKLIGAVAWNSNIRDFEKLSTKLAYQSEAGQNQLSISAIINDKTTEIRGGLSNLGSYKVRAYAGDLTITTPYSEPISAEFDYAREAEKLQATFDLKLAENQAMKAQLEGQFAQNNVSGSFKLNSPVRGFEEMTTSFVYVVDKGDIVLRLQAKLNDQEMKAEVSGGKSWNRRNTTYKVGATVETPFTQAFVTSVSFAEENRQITSTGIMTLDGDKVITFNVSGTLLSLTKLDLKASGNFFDNQISSRLTSDMEGSKVATSADITLNGQKYLLSVNGDNQTRRKSRMFYANVKLNTPVLSDVSFSTEFSKKSTSVVGSAKLSYASTIHSVAGKIGSKDPLNYEGSLELEAPQLSVKLMSLQTWNGKTFSHESLVSNSGKTLRFTGSCDVKKDRTNLQASGNGVITTPWSDDVKLSFTHKQKDGELRPEVTFTYGKSKEVKVSTLLSILSNALTFKVTVAPNFCDAVILTSSYEFKNKQSSAAASFEWQKNRKVTFDLKGAFDKLATDAKLTLKTPLDGFKVIGLNLSYDLVSTEKILSVVGNIDAVKAELKANAGMVGSKAKVDVSLTTPVPSFETTTAKATLDLHAKQAELIVNAAGQEIKAVGNFRQVGTKGVASLKYSNPFADTKTVSLEVNYDGSSDKKVQVVFETDKTRSDMQAKLAYSSTSGVVEVVLNTPIKEFELMGVKAAFDLPKRTLLFNTRKNSAEINFEASNPSGALQLALTTPFEIASDIALSAKYTPTSIGATLSLNSQKFTLTADYVNKSKSLEASGSLVTPMRGLEEIKGDFNWDWSKDDQTLNLNVSRGSKAVAANATFNFKDLLASSVGINVSSPFTASPIEAVFKYDLKSIEKSAEANFSTGAAIYSIQVSGFSSSKGARLSFSTNLPIQGYETLSGEGSYDVSVTPMQMLLSFTKNAESIFDVRAEVDLIHISIAATTIFKGYEELKFESALQRDEDFRVSVSGSKNGLKVRVVLTNSVDQTEVKLETPVNDWEVISFRIKYDFDAEQKFLHVEVKRNGENYNLTFDGVVSLKNTDVILSFNSNAKNWENVSVSAKYDVRKTITGTFAIEKNGTKKAISGDVNLSPNEAKVQVQTPFTGFRDVQVSTKFSKTKAELSFQRENSRSDFSASLTFDKDATTATLRTPFTGFEELAGTLRYDIMTADKVVSLTLINNNARVDVSSSLSLYPDLVALDSSFSSTFNGFERIDLSGKYERVGAKLETSASFQLNTFKYDAVVTTVDRSDSMEVTVQVSTPIRRWEQTKINGTILKQEKKATFNVDRNGEQHEISATVDVTPSSFKATLETPFTGFETISVAAKYDDSSLEAGVHTPFRGFETLSLSGDYDLTSESKMARVTVVKGISTYENIVRARFTPLEGAISAQSSLPFLGFENSALDFVYDFDFADNNLGLVANAQKGLDRVEGSMQVKLGEKSADFSARFVSPFRSYEDIEASCKYDLDRVGKTAALTVEVKGQAVLTLSGTFGVSALQSDLGIIVILPLVSEAKTELSFKHDFASSRRTVSAGVRIKDSHFEVKALVDNRKSGNFVISSNSKNLSDVEATWTIDNGRIELDLNVGENRSIRLSSDVKINSIRDVTIRGSLETFFTNRQELRVELNALRVEKSYATLHYKYGDVIYNFDANTVTSEDVWQLESTIRTPHRGFELVSTLARYGKNVATAEAKFGGQKVVITANFDLKQLRSSTVLRVEAPFVDVLEISCDYDVSGKEKSGQAIFSYGETRVRLTGVANVKSKTESEARIQLTSNTGMDYGASVRYNFLDSLKTAFAEFKANGVATSIEGSISSDPLKPSVMFNVMTPLKAYENIRVSAEADFSKGFSVQFTTRGLCDLEANFSAQQNSIRGSLATPFDGLKDIRLDCDYSLGKDASVHITATHEDNLVTLSFSNANGHFNAKLAAPFEGFRTIELDGVLPDISSPRGQLTLTKDEQSVTLVGTVLEGAQKGVKFQFVSPSSTTTELLLSFNLDSNAKSAEAVLRLPGEEVRVILTGQLEPFTSASLTLESQSFDTVSINLNFDRTGPIKSLRVIAGYDNKHLEFESAFGRTKEHSLATATVSLPIEGYERLAFKAVSTKEDIDLTLEYGPDQIIQFLGSAKMGSGFSVSGTLRTPFESVKTLSGELYFELSAKAKGGKLSAQWNDSSKFTVSGLLEADKLEITLQTPFEKVRDFSVIVGYNYSLSSNSFAASLEVQKARIAIESTFDSHGIQAKVSTSDKSISFSARFQYVQASMLKATFSIQTPFINMENISFDLDAVMNDDDFVAKLNTKTPLKALPEFAAELQFSNNREGVRTALNYSLHGVTADVKVNVNFVDRSVELSSDVSSCRFLDGLRLAGQMKKPTESSYQLELRVLGKDFENVVNAGYSYSITSLNLSGKLVSDRLSQPLTASLDASLSEDYSKGEVSVDIVANTLAINYDISSKPLRVDARASLPFVDLDTTAVTFNISPREFGVVLLLPQSTHSLASNFNIDELSFNGSAELETPLLDVKHSLRFTGTLPEVGYSPISIEGTLEGSAVHVVSAAVDLRDKFEFRGRSNSPYTGEVEMELLAGSLDGIITIETQEATHKAKYQVIKSGSYEIAVDAESPYIADDRISVRAMVRKNSNLLEATLTTETGSGSHTVSGELRQDKDSLLFRLKAETSILNLDVAAIELRANRGRRTEAVFAADLYRRTHKVSVGYQNEPLQAEFKAESPFLSGGSWTALLNTKYETGHEASAEVELSYGKNTIRVDGAATYATWKDMQFSANLQSPFKAFGQGSFTAHFKTESGINTGVELKTSLSVLPQAGILFKYEPTNTSYDASLAVKTPMERFSNLSLLMNIPITSTSVEPRLTANLMNEQFVMSGAWKNSEERMEMSALGEGAGKKIGGSVILKKAGANSLLIEAFTPVKGYEKFSVNLKNEQGASSSSTFMDWNGQRIEFTSAFGIDAGVFVTKIELKTPFASFEKYGVNVRIEKTERKTVIIELLYPGNQVGVNFDYLFSSFTDFILKVSATTPSASKFTVELSNRVSRNAYSGSIEGQIFNQGFGLTIEGDLRSGSAQGNIEAKLNEYAVALNSSGEVTDKSLDASVTLSTPFKRIHSFDARAHLEKNFVSVDNIIAANLNGESLFTAVVNDKEGGRSIEITNPIYPVSLTYKVEKVGELDKLIAQFCWNINSRASSTIGIESTLSIGTRKILAAKATLPTRVVNLNFSLENSEATFDNVFNLSWEEGRTFGYRIVVVDQNTRGRSQKDSVIRVDFPVRSFELEFHTAATRSETSLSADFKWDAARDLAKQMGFVVEVADKSSWGTTSKAYAATLSHYKLAHDLIFKADYTISLPTDILIFGTSFQYSEVERELFLAQIAINDESTYNNMNYKALVSVQHLVSHINFKATADAFCETHKLGGSIRVDYRDIIGSDKFIDAVVAFDKKHQKLSINAKTADQSIAVSGGYKKDRDQYTLVAQTSINGEPPVKVEAKGDSKRPSIKVHVHVNKKTVKLYAGFPTSKEIKGKISHEFMGKTVVDSLFSLRLDTSKILANRVYWRPDAQQEFINVFHSYSSDLSQAFAKTKESINAFITEERAQKVAGLSSVVSAVYTTYAEAYTEEMGAIMKDFSDVIDSVKKLYANDDFFMKTVMQAFSQIQAKFIQASVKTVSNISCVFSAATSGLQESARFILDVTYQIYSKAGSLLPARFLVGAKAKIISSVSLVVKAFKASVEDFRRHVEELAAMVKPTVQKYYGRLEEAVMYHVELVEDRFTNIVRGYVDAATSYVQKFKHVYEWTQDKYDMVVSLAEDLEAEIRARVAKLPLVQKISKLYKTYYAWLEEIHFQDYIDDIMNQFSGVAKEKFNSVTARYRPYIRAAVQAVKGQYKLVKELPPVAYFSTLIDRVLLEAQKIWSLVVMKEQLVENIRTFLKQLDETMKSFPDQARGAVADIDLSKMLKYRGTTGKFEATVNLPMEWRSLKELPDFKTLPIYQQYEVSKNGILDYFDFSNHHYHFLDTVARFKDDFTLKSVLPPFGTHALIAGNQHYMTFDRKFFEFAGECSYLLVNDFTDGNFSVVVNYEGSSGKFTKKSLTVLTTTKQLEISSSKVVVDGKRVEMPYQDDEVTVFIDGSRITLETPRGARVECNLFRDACTVHVTGWSFGKTAGLFGVYNHEPSDDFSTSDRERRSDSEVDSFAHSWRVGSSRCRVKNTAAVATIADPKAEDACSRMFDHEKSFLLPCFKLVDAAPYKNMCINDLSGLVNSVKQDLAACTAATAYAMECRLHGVDIWVPPQCVRCNLGDGNVLLSGESKGFDSRSPAPKSADIVFLVEQKKCLKNSRIATIPQEMDLAMKEKGYSNNRYAVVTFGGKGVFENPHIRTSDSEPWNNRKAIQKAFEGLDYDGEEASDAVAAMTYASRLSFRAGVSKHLVLISCESTCHAQDYGDAVTLLLENDFKLHIMRPEKLKLKGKKVADDAKILAQIYGYDSTDVYTSRSGRRFGGEKDLRRQLQIPKDFCTPLALETNGTVFDLNKIVGSKAQSPKKVVDVFAKRFALTAEPAPCQRCDCLGDKDGVGTMHCQRCISPAIDKFLKEWETAVYDSEMENVDVDNFPLTEIRIKPEDPDRSPRKIQFGGV